jgi:uncharacterized protein (TIGR00251 family)
VKEPGPLRSGGAGLLLDVKAIPSASRTEFVDVRDGRLRVRIAAAPEDGKANRELCAAVAAALGCAKSAVRLASGEKSRLKTLSLPPELAAAAAAFLAALP